MGLPSGPSLGSPAFAAACFAVSSVSVPLAIASSSSLVTVPSLTPASSASRPSLPRRDSIVARSSGVSLPSSIAEVMSFSSFAEAAPSTCSCSPAISCAVAEPSSTAFATSVMPASASFADSEVRSASEMLPSARAVASSVLSAPTAAGSTAVTSLSSSAPFLAPSSNLPRSSAVSSHGLSFILYSVSMNAVMSWSWSFLLSLSVFGSITGNGPPTPRFSRVGRVAIVGDPGRPAGAMSPPPTAFSPGVSAPVPAPVASAAASVSLLPAPPSLPPPPLFSLTSNCTPVKSSCERRPCGSVLRWRLKSPSLTSTSARR